MKLTKKEQLARSKICLPLDGIKSLSELKRRVKDLSPVVGLFKIGKESYTRFGPDAVYAVHQEEAEVFLDLKYHDIPNTVRGAANAAASMGVYMFNVHASGGYEMMKAAVEGINMKGANGKPKIVGVTILTSLDKKIMNLDLRIPGSVEDQVLHLAQNAQRAGLDGIVCSAADLSYVKNKLPNDFMYVTPGIKGLKGAVGNDQKRIFTPANAIVNGSSILVVGRAITDPRTTQEKEKELEVTLDMQLKAGYEIIKDMAKVL